MDRFVFKTAIKSKTIELKSWNEIKSFGSSLHLSLNAHKIINKTKSKFQSNTKRLSIHEERLLQILEKKFDQPLTIDENDDSPTSSICNNTDENVPPPGFVAHAEDCQAIQTMESDTSEASILQCTPPNQTPIELPYITKLQRDLNSPSATIRLRALRALRSPNKGNYCNFDIPHEEQDIITEEERRSPLKPKTIQDVMKDVVVYVEVRTDADNRSDGIKKVISELGVQVNEKLFRNTTHVIFKDGLLSTYNKAKNWNIPIVSILWIETCRKQLRLVDPAQFTISNIDRYENPELFKRMRKQKSRQPNAEENIKIKKPKVTPVDQSDANDFNLHISKTPIENTSIPHTKYQTRTESSFSNNNVKTVVAISPENIATNEQKVVARVNARRSLFNHVNTSEEIDICDSDSSKRITVNLGNVERRNTRRNSMLLNEISQCQTEKTVNITDSSAKTPYKRSRRYTMFTPNLAQIDMEESNEIEQNANIDKSTTYLNLNTSSRVPELNVPNRTQTKNRRKTMYTPTVMEVTKSSVKTIEKEKEENPNGTKTLTNGSLNRVTKTTSKNRHAITSVLNSSEIIQNPMKTSDDRTYGRNTINSVTKSNTKQTPVIRDLLLRHSKYSPHSMEQTNIITDSYTSLQEIATPLLHSSYLESDVTTVQDKNANSTSNRRRTLFTPNRVVEINKNMEVETTNQLYGKKDSVIVRSLPIAQQNDQTLNKTQDNPLTTYNPPKRNISRKTITPTTSNLNSSIVLSKPHSLLDEYNKTLTFSSTATPKSAHRKTIYDISMEIIDQRIQNINKIAKLNRSVSESDVTMDELEKTINSSITNLTPILPTKSITVQSKINPITNSAKSQHNNKTITEIENNTKNVSTDPIKPVVTKRKLFAPSSLFDINSLSDNSITNPCTNITTTAIKTNSKTDKSDVKKRNRDDGDVNSDQPIVKKFKNDTVTKDKIIITTKKTKIIRRSTMDFQSPKQSQKSKSTAVILPKQQQKLPFLVYTNMHAEQINVIKKAVTKLGQFRLENTVTDKTTHVVSLGARRTINFLRAITRGLWILNYDWILDSLKHGKWLYEEPFEVRDFSKAVSICRAERQALGSKYKMDIFKNVGFIYIAPNCECPNLSELIILCGGKVTDSQRRAKYIIGKYKKDAICLSPLWILDSLSIAKIKKIHNYLIEENT